MSPRQVVRKCLAAVSRAFAFLRVALANIFIVLLLVALVAVILSAPESAEVPDGAALVVAPKGAIVEQPARPTFPFPPSFSDVSGQTKAEDIIEAIEHAASDERVGMLAMDLTDLEFASTAQMEAIGEAIEEFQEAGKTVVATSDVFTQRQYYLASFADEIYMHPFGQLMLTGVGAYRDYYGSLMEKLKVNVHVYTASAPTSPRSNPSFVMTCRSMRSKRTRYLWTICGEAMSTGWR